VELYRIGWKICRKDGDEFVLVRGVDEKVGEKDFEE
jgi:hypothetical protein